MNAFAQAPMRDARYAAPLYAIAPGPGGDATVSNQADYFQGFVTTNAALDHWAATAPSRVWLAERSGPGWRTLTFGEAEERVSRLAGALAGLGLGPGRPLLILAGNSIDHALITYAAMRIGAPAAPVSPQYGRPGADPARLAHAAALIGPAAVYVEDADASAEALISPALSATLVIASRAHRPGQYGLETLCRDAAAVADPAAPDGIAKLLLTSGSTGQPKAVICTQSNIALNSAQIAACFDDPEPPVLVNAAPWSHSLGANAILHMTLHRGGTLYIDAGQPVAGRFGETLRNLAEIPTTYHNMVPAGWALLADALERDEALARIFFSRIRVMQNGGASQTQALSDRVQAAAVRTVGEQITFAAGYGSTETGPTACNVHWPNTRAGLLGLPVAGTSVKLAAQDDKLELRVRGPQISPGYYDARTGLVQPLPLDEDGYCRMGDAVRWADPERPTLGLAFDGRLSENFKLAIGAFVTTGGLRLAALSALDGLALDAVVCGEGQDGVGLMLFVARALRERLGEAALIEQIHAGLARHNRSAAGLGGKIARALVLDDLPDARSGEVTDKGYLNQHLARARRTAQIERLFARSPDPSVIVLA